MGWYLLKDRRKLGPFELEEIKKEFEKGRIELTDYLVPERIDLRHSLEYPTVAELLKLAVHVAQQSEDSNPEKNEKVFVEKLLDDPESREKFEEGLEPVDLMAGAPDELEVSDEKIILKKSGEDAGQGFSAQMERLWGRYQKFLLALSSIGLFLGAMTFLYENKESLPTQQAAITQKKSTPKVSSAPKKPKKRVSLPRRRPADDSLGRVSPRDELRVPEEREERAPQSDEEIYEEEPPAEEFADERYPEEGYEEEPVDPAEESRRSSAPEKRSRNREDAEKKPASEEGYEEDFEEEYFEDGEDFDPEPVDDYEDNY